MGLLDVRARRAAAQKGARLLPAKREALTGELVRRMRQVVKGREALDEALRQAVNALEQLVPPGLVGEARRVAAALEERDREDAVRLRRFRGRRAR